MTGQAHHHDDHAHHHEHAHDHAHPHEHGHGPRRAEPGLSLLRMSAAQRLGGAAVVLALLWGGVFWALT